MSKHTPGPWEVDCNTRGEVTAIMSGASGGREWTCVVGFDSATPCWDDGATTRGIDEDENHANARLIAAAPEMFELLKRMDQIKGEPNDFDLADWLFDLRALIAKVEGEG